MKKVLFILLFCAIGVLAWFLFVRPYDLQVRFTLKTKPGVVRQLVKLWDKNDEGRKIIAFSPEGIIEQEAVIGEHTYQLRWMVEMINDSVSQVKVQLNEEGQAIINRMAGLFTNSELERNAEKALKEFHRQSAAHLKRFRVRVDGIAEYPSTFCLYVPLKTSQATKAHGMMDNYSLLSTFITEQGYEIAGVPFLTVKQWDEAMDIIEYDFCYPIVKPDSLPDHPLIQYQNFEGGKALKATYNGNYISSDRAWYELLHEAEKRSLATKGEVIEYFYDNPNFGGDDLKWTAEIFMPLAD